MSGRTTVTLPKDLHQEVFGEDGMKPYQSMSNAEFIKEMAKVYQKNSE